MAANTEKKALSLNLDDSEQNPVPRAFPDVINEWTNELLRLNKDATLEQVGLILRLGTLGQRLIYEANAIGQNEALSHLSRLRST